MRVTLKDVARLATVNFTLVSKYINQTPGVRMRPETRQRIESAIHELKYQPITVARALRYGRTDTLGLIVGNLTNEYFAHYADSAIIEAEKLGFRLLISVCKDGDPEKAIRGLYANQVDGIVCCDCFNPGSAPCPMLTERSFSMASMKKAVADSMRYLAEHECSSITGLFTDDRWPEIFSSLDHTPFISQDFQSLPHDPAERRKLLRGICGKRPDAIFSTGWKTVNMLSVILEKEFPDYDPLIILWANCKGHFLANPRIRGVLHTSTLLSIKETFTSLANMVASSGEVRRPAPVPCRFIPREKSAYGELIVEEFSLT